MVTGQVQILGARKSHERRDKVVESRQWRERFLMRIYTAVRHANDPKQFYGGLWSGNFYPALRRLGHEIIESQVDLLPASRFMERAEHFTADQLRIRSDITQRIVDEVKAAHMVSPIELFLGYFYNAHFDPAGFSELDRLGIPTVNFYCNSIHQFELVAAIAAKVGFAWHAEKHARHSYLKAGANPVWVQMAADPEVYRPRTGIRREPKSCFVGQKYADRDRALATLIRAGVPVEIYGSGWTLEGNHAATIGSCLSAKPQRGLAARAAAYLAVVRHNIRSQGSINGLRRTWQQTLYRRETRRLAPLLGPHARGPAADVADTFAAYEVVLNFSNVWADGRPGASLIPHVRLRDFEAPMCRTCYVTGHTDEIEEFYSVGAEIDTYRTPEELAEKVRYYLSHPDAAERLREAGFRRARRDHTWECRFRELFGKIGLGTPCGSGSAGS
jgi:spore maturation protein CgeB